MDPRARPSDGDCPASVPDLEVLGRVQVVAHLAATLGPSSGGITTRSVALIGPPGSGLSTVLRHVASVLRSTLGAARLVRFPDARLDAAALAAFDGALVVDDAHLGTADQVLALRDRSLLHPTALGVRTGAAPGELAWTWRSGAIDSVDLLPLGDTDVGRIVEERAGGHVHRVTRDGIVHRAAGRPAFAVDEIDSLIADERLVFQAGLWRGRLTGRVGDHLFERARDLLAELPADLASSVETVAVAGAVPHDALARLRIAVPELRRRLLIDHDASERATAVRLVPPALGAAVRATLAPDRAVQLAREVLATTSPASLAPDDRARLLTLAGEHVELTELEAAARTALRGDDRLEVVNLAREMGGRGPEGLSLEADFLAELGARAEAAERYAALMIDPAAPPGLRARAAMEHSLVQMWDLAQPDDAVATATALAAVTGDTPVGPAARVHLAALTLYAGRPAQAAATLTSVAPDRLDETMRAGYTLVRTIADAMTDPCRAAPDDARWLTARDEGGSFEHGVALASVGLSFELLGRYREAEILLDGARTARPSGTTPSSAAWAALARARCELAIGRPQPAKRAAIESAADFADVNHPSGLRWAIGASMLASAMAGDTAATRDAVAVFDGLEPGVPFLDVDLLRARAWAAWRLGNSTLAAARFTDAIDLAVTSGAVTLEAVALHDTFRLLRTPVADRLAALARAAPVPAIVLRARHVAAVAAGDPDELLLVTAALEANGALLLAAEAAGDAARLAASDGRRGTARTAVGHRVRLAGMCGNPATPGLADHQPAALTSRERDVATLAAEGHTSREIAAELSVSVRTVDNLLQRAYVKLGVHGRAELVARLSP